MVSNAAMNGKSRKMMLRVGMLMLMLLEGIRVMIKFPQTRADGSPPCGKLSTRSSRPSNRPQSSSANAAADKRKRAGKP